MTQTTKNKLTKQAFILAQPREMHAADVVAAAKKVGLDISKGYVITARSNARRASTRQQAVKRGRPQLPAGGASFRTLGEYAMRVGIDRARAELKAFEEKVATLNL